MLSSYNAVNKRPLRSRKPIRLAIEGSIEGILKALNDEEACKSSVSVKVSKAVSSGPLTTIYFETSSTDCFELREGWRASGVQADGSPWHAEIIDVDLYEPRSVVVSNGKEPIYVESGQICRFSRPDFLGSLKSWIAQERLRGAGLPASYLDLLDAATSFAASKMPIERKLEAAKSLNLRSAQKRAVSLASRSFGIVWGPPGTGKTYTLGALASVLQSKGKKILVLAPTNVAADNAALAIDNAMTLSGRALQPGELIRPGRPVLAELEERHHLMAWTQQLEETRTVLRQKSREIKELEKRRRLSNGLRRKQRQLEIATLLLEERNLKSDRSRQMWEVAHRANIIVTTLHSAMNNEELLSAIVDEEIYLLLDEAGMVPRFFLARIMDLNPKKLFLFGDFKQLGPIWEGARKKNPNSKYWIADSALKASGVNSLDDAVRLEKSGLLVLLNEQSRMSQELCLHVSNTFYGGRLQTVGKNNWRSDADLQNPKDGIVIVDPDVWCKKFAVQAAVEPLVALEPAAGSEPLAASEPLVRNYCRNSVHTTVGLTRRLLAENDKHSVLMLSPFKAQAAELQKCALALLEDDGRWKAGTIHISQGQESDFVLLNPVNPGHKWLTGAYGKEDLERVLCVAFSRAKKQVIVVARPEEIVHSPLLSQLCCQAPVWEPDNL